MKLILAFLGSAILVTAAGAIELKKCVVCQNTITKTIYFKTGPYLTGKQPVCEPCIEIEQECFTCTLPVKHRFVDLKDGRYLCERDAKAAVLSGETAQQLFAGVKRDLMAMFAGTGKMPDKEIEIALVDRRRMESLHRVQRFPHAQHATVGLTRTVSNGNGELRHEVFVLTGMNPARFMAVAAHEYTHAWLQQNLATDRAVDGDTVEGFCEYVGYRLMQQKGEQIEMNLIVTNDYTHGQIHVFLQIDPSRFYEVAKWMKGGADQTLDANALERVFVLKDDSAPATPGWAMANKSHRPSMPTSLVLKSVTGTSKRRFALINDQTFGPNELGRVRLGTSNVTIRCLEVSESAAVIQLVSTGEKRRLVLEDQ